MGARTLQKGQQMQMTNGLARLLAAAVVLMAGLLLSGCEEKVTLANYEQITVGMTKLEVERILGGGKNETASGGLGISSEGLPTGGDKPDEVWVWAASDGSKIVLTFAEGKVVQKRQEGLE